MGPVLGHGGQDLIEVRVFVDHDMVEAFDLSSDDFADGGIGMEDDNFHGNFFVVPLIPCAFFQSLWMEMPRV